MHTFSCQKCPPIASHALAPRRPSEFDDPPLSLARLVLATAALIVVLIGATEAVLLVSYRDTLHQEQTNLRNLSIAFAAQTFSVAQGVDNVMLEAERS